MHSECEDGSSSSSEDSGGDTGDSSAVQTEQLESNSDSSDVSSENGSKGEMDEAAAGWTSKKRKNILVSNKHGATPVHGGDMDTEEFWAYVGLFILAGVYR